MQNLFPIDTQISFCPVCGKQIESQFIVKGDFLYLRRRCKNHIKKDEVLHKVDEVLPHYLWNSKIKELINVKRYWRGIKAIDLLVTRKCNSNCKVCFVKYGKENYEEMSVENFKSILKVLHSAKVVLNGGEVTLREDLEELIKLTLESGNFPVVYTNGLKFSNRNYLKRLKKIGLKEVVISFEGFKEEIYERLRGGAYQLKLVMKALENLKKENIKTSLYCTVAKGINDDQIPYILRYMASNKFIWTVAFKPIYLVGTSRNSNLTKKNIPSYSELLEIIGKEVNGVNSSYVLQLQKLFYSLQREFARNNPLYFSWLEIPTIFVRRKGGKLEPFPPYLLGSSKILNKTARLIASAFSLHNGGLLKLENYLFNHGIGKIVLGTIAPYVSPYVVSSPTLRQMNGKIVLSSYLAW
jgi:uncharacterized radical SAM superfamily Fe-S cluster-containing enzyme